MHESGITQATERVLSGKLLPAVTWEQRTSFWTKLPVLVRHGLGGPRTIWWFRRQNFPKRMHSLLCSFYVHSENRIGPTRTRILSIPRIPVLEQAQTMKPTRKSHHIPVLFGDFELYSPPRFALEPFCSIEVTTRLSSSAHFASTMAFASWVLLNFMEAWRSDEKREWQFSWSLFTAKISL